jgi:hypothetical protein
MGVPVMWIRSAGGRVGRPVGRQVEGTVKYSRSAGSAGQQVSRSAGCGSEAAAIDVSLS